MPRQILLPRSSRERAGLTVAGCVLSLLLLTSAAVAQPETGGQAPPFELATLDGETVSLADQRGKIVVLHFGTGW